MDTKLSPVLSISATFLALFRPRAFIFRPKFRLISNIENMPMKEYDVESTLKTPAPRTPLNLEVSFKRNYAREETNGILKNISITGAFLEFHGGEVRPNEKLHLVIMVAGRERKLAAHVIWVNSLGVGIKFLPVNNRDVQIVDDLIYFVENSRNDRRSVFDTILKKVS